jgi:G3E family GTPase
MNSLPVTIISGFPGAGKTAVIQYVVKESPGLKIGVVSNEVQSDNLLNAAMNLAAMGVYDYLMIEAPGDSEPTLVAEALSLHADGVEKLNGLHIDTMVTVVDAQNFLDDFQSVDEFRDRGPASDPEDDRDIARVLIEQIEFANVILLNKTDLLSEEEVGQLLAVLRKLNPDARVLEIEKGCVSADEVINTGRYQSDSEVAADVWQSVLSSDETGSADEYGISSIVYRARRPFHPQRFWDFWMDGEHAPCILRSKGYFWLATKNSVSGFWSHVGQVLAAEPGGAWWAETPREEWPSDDPELMAELNSVWDEVWGDRRQELILIGQDLDAVAARKALDKCLLTESEMESGPVSWSQLEDPFGCWQAGHDCDGSHDHDHG